jgi:hypothetical protein
MAQIQYKPITNVRFDNEGNIIMKSTTSAIAQPTLSSSDNNGEAWSAGKTIFELQNKAFGDLKGVLNTARTNSTTSSGILEPPSFNIYYKAILSVVNYNNGARQAAVTGNLTEYPQIVFYNTYNGNVDYRKYENLIKSRDFIKAKMDYINGAPGSLSHEQSIQSLNGVYTNTLVAIAAVSLLYMAFISL